MLSKPPSETTYIQPEKRESIHTVTVCPLCLWDFIIRCSTRTPQKYYAFIRFHSLLATAAVVPLKYSSSISASSSISVDVRMFAGGGTFPVPRQQNKTAQDVKTKGDFAGSGSIVVSLCQKQQYQRAMELYEQNPDPAGCSALIAALWRDKKDLDLCFNCYKTLLPHQPPSLVVFKALATACNKSNNPHSTCQLWADMKQHSVIPDKMSFGMLTGAAAKTGNVSVALDLVHIIQTNDTVKHSVNEVDCTQIIQAFANGKAVQHTVKVLNLMEQLSIKPSEICFLCILSGCTSPEHLEIGTKVHSILCAQGMNNLKLQTTLISMYSKCGSLEQALSVFQSIKMPDVQCWSAMVQAYHHHKQNNRALQLFYDMQQLGSQPNQITFLSVISACGDLGDLEKAKKLHKLVKDYNLHQVVAVQTALLTMFAKCGSIDTAAELFADIPFRDIAAWNAMLSAYIQVSDGKSALNLFNQLQEQGVKPNSITYLLVFTACGLVGNLSTAKKYHKKLQQDIGDNMHVHNALINMYSNCGSLEDACLVFDRMKQRDTGSWNSIMEAYRHHQEPSQAIELFNQMQHHLQPDFVSLLCVNAACADMGNATIARKLCNTALNSSFGKNLQVRNSLVNMLSECGFVEDAYEIFCGMEQKDLLSYGTMIASFIVHDQEQQAIALFEDMKLSGIQPNSVVYCNLLTACANVMAFNLGRALHAQISKDGLVDLRINNCLINMYGKCGSVAQAYELFSKMPERDLISWNSMIASYAQNGCAHQAIQLFTLLKNEKKLQPDDTTFVAVLNACSHAKLVDTAMSIFNSIETVLNCKPSLKHVTCMVDTFARSGCLQQAEDFLNTTTFTGNIVPWRALLGGCRTHKDAARAQRLAETALQIAPNDPSTYVMLANTHAQAGNIAASDRVRDEMKQRGVVQIPGISYVEANGKLHKLLLDDKTHPMHKQIREKLDEMKARLAGRGYQHDVSWVLKPLSDEEKEGLLCSHSEQSALALGLLLVPENETIRITKKIRMCADCHSSTTATAAEYKRSIIVKAAKRFHHITADGKCSCTEYPSG